jgi:uncharacterized protein YcbX
VTGSVAHIWRHPIKAHGREPLGTVRLTDGTTIPWDRTWAVAHAEARLDGAGWYPCQNFLRAAKAPGLMALSASLDEAKEIVTLHHPALGVLTFRPDEEPGRFLEWVAPLVPADRPPPVGIVRAKDRGMTDSEFPSLSLNNHASRRALSDKAGRELSMHRFRGNIWIDGLAPWEEFDWVGRIVRVGSALLSVEERIGRCRATEVEPATGRRDTNVLGLLEEGWGHRDFGVHARVVGGGEVSVGQLVEALQ